MGISGFMVVKNVVEQGYPFLEAIAAALPICDEFLVSDGYSTDGTWTALEAIQRKFSSKIKLFRDEWRGKTASGEIIGTMTNTLKERCSTEYCLNVQANEIIHEESLDALRLLPKWYPQVEFFRLPFYSLMGGEFVWMAVFMRRLFKNKEYLISRGDGFDVGYRESYLYSHPRKFIAYLRSGKGERVYYLPQPVYRYRALFPKNYLSKLVAHADLYQEAPQNYWWKKEYAFAASALQQCVEKKESPEAFWHAIKSYFDEAMWNDSTGRQPGPEIPRRAINHPLHHPRGILHLLNKWEYDLKDSLRQLE